MGFTKATKQAATVKLAITGPSGSGKTYSALLLARGLGGKVAVLDTEYGSASLYSDSFNFDTWDEQDPKGYPPEHFISVIKAAEQAGYSTLIIDSLSHEWSGRGGCLELADLIARTRYRGNSWSAWSEVTPRHNALVEAITSAKINIIATMRAKTEYVLTEKNGKSAPQKVGLGSIQRDGMDYEFTVMFELDRDTHTANAGKDRTNLFRDPGVITEKAGERLRDWLTTGTPNNAPKFPVNDAEPNQVSEIPAIQEPPQKTQKKPAKKQDPREYVEKDLKARVSASENPAEGSYAACKLYADILKTDEIRYPKDMNDEEIKIIAIELFKRDRATQRKETTNQGNGVSPDQENH